MTDAPKPPTEQELAAAIQLVVELRTNLLQQGNVAAAHQVEADTRRLVAEVRRLRGLLNTASSYLVDQDAHCQGCDRAIIRGDHAPDCPVWKIEAEFGSEVDR